MTLPDLSITSFAFAVFVAVGLVGYYFIPRKWQNAWLLAVSLFFCVSWSWQFALTLVFTSAVNHRFGRIMHQTKERAKRLRISRWGVGFNLLVLAGFKYADFFVPQMFELFGRIGLEGSAAIQILLPIGLSYYTLENISYVIDTSRKQTPKDTSLLDYLLYSAYFPKLIAGPIERARNFLPKLTEERIVTEDHIVKGFALIIVGLFRKVVVADVLWGLLPPNVLFAPQQFSNTELFYWVIMGIIYVYNDFAGYTSIVRGVSLFFGIELSRNFLNPLFSRNFNEVWDRWHISLSHWLRDYVFFPVNRALLRRKFGRKHILSIALPPMATMVISGVWHDVGWNMIIWGALNGLWLVGEQVRNIFFGRVKPDELPLWRQMFGTAVIWLLFGFAGLFFIFEVPEALNFARSLLRFRGVQWPDPAAAIRTAVLAAAALSIDWSQVRKNDELYFLGWRPTYQSAALALALILIISNSLYSTSAPFVYQEF